MRGDRPLVLIGQPMLAGLIARLQPHYEVLPLWEDSGRARIADVRVLVTAGEVRIDPAHLAAMTQLGLIACFTVGYDGVDVMEMRARGVAVTHGGNSNAEDVADHAIGLLLAQRRQIVEGDRQLRSGQWAEGSRIFTRSLNGARLGIVGMGSIGQAVARRAQAMHMHIRWWGPHKKRDLPWHRAQNLDVLAAQSDILVVAARADESNRGLISAEILEALGPQGLLINVARGQLVDEDALIAALKSGALGGAALDVFSQEPTPFERWADVPNCVLTPHSAGATDAAVTAMTQLLMANLSAYFAGEPLVSPVP